MNFRFLSHPKNELYYEIDELIGLVEQINLMLHKIIEKRGQEHLIEVSLRTLYLYSLNIHQKKLYFSYTVFCNKLMEYINKQKACGVVMLEICEIEACVKEIPTQLVRVNSKSTHFRLY
jgi:hypothetical protein